MKKVVFLLALILFGIKSQCQSVFEGKVLSKDGKSLAEASIIPENAKKIIYTNDSGFFKLTIPNSYNVIKLTVSRVGYISKKLEFNKSAVNVVIVLEPEDQSLDEVVVVGYGTQKKKDLTGSVVSLSRDRLQSLPNNNFTQALQGSLPGVTVTTNNAGAEGNEVSILIGGRNSITAGSRPLIIFDGIPYEGGFSDINPDDIQSIEILKDASAVAIYGARGSNGVILITGKTGKKGRTNISLDLSHGQQTIAKRPNLLSPSEFYEFKKFRNPGAITPSEEAIYAAGTGVNWYDLASRDGSRTSASLSVSGGNDQTTFNLGLSSLNVAGLAKGDNFKRYTLRPSIDIKVNKFVNVGSNTLFTFLDRSGSSANFSGASGQGANLANPLTSPYNQDGSISIYAWPEYNLMGNPINNLLIANTDYSNKLFSSNYIKVALPIKGLSYKLNSGTEITNRTIRTSWGRNTTNGYQKNGAGQIISSTERNFTLENILNYSRDFGDHSINVTALYSSQSHDYESDASSGSNFPNIDMNFSYNLDQSDPATRKTSSTVFKENHISQMGRFNYSYKSKYLFTLTSRRDGYSGFGLDTKYGLFTTAAVAWNLTRENFLKLPGYVSFLKIRTSYGQNGNEAVGAYQTLTTLKNNAYVIGGSTDTLKIGYIPQIAGNPLLAWESTNKLTVGVDFGFFNNRITGSIDYYSSITGNPGLLLKKQVSPITGYTSVLTNIGKVKNSGIEVALNTRNIVKKDFTWSSNIVFAFNKNKIVDLYGDGKDDVGNKWFIGQPINVNYDLLYDGIYSNAKDSINSAIKSPLPRLGNVRVKDINGDSIISTASDRTIIGQLDPKITWGLTNIFTYKQFSLSIFIHSVVGVTKENPLAQDNVGTDVVTNTTKKDWWSVTNPNGTHWANNNTSNISPTTIKIFERADFIRLKDISLGYSLPSSILKKSGFTSFKIYATARNLFTITNYNGLDPELGAAYQLSVPLQRELTFGVTVGL